MKRRTKDVADQRVGREEPEAEPSNQRWWKSRGGRDATMALWAWTDERRSYLRGYNSLDLIHEAIYEGRPVGRRISYAASEFLRAQKSASSYLNVLQSMVDTVVARQSKRRPMSAISCDDAEYSEKLYARRATRVVRRKMGTPLVERVRPMMIRDGIVRGDGFVKMFRDGGDVSLERVPRCELVFDDGECTGQGSWPRSLSQVKRMDRDTLSAMFPKAKDRIKRVSPASRDVWSPFDYDSPIDADLVEVCEGWHLPSVPGAKDGRHAIVIRDGGEPLQWREWCRPRYPFARIQWTPSMRGFIGIGLVQQLAGSQHKVNELWADHQDALYWGSALKIFQPRQANVDKNHMRARHPAIIETDGPAPTFIAPDPASRQAMDSLRWLIQEMYEISGISQSSASSRSPMGPNASGKAIETVYDIESDRFAQFELQIAMAAVDMTMCILDEAKDMAEQDDDSDVELAPWISEIDWKRFNFDGGGYHLVPEPVGFLPETRGGKLEALNDLAKIPGLLTDPLQMASLFEEPDIARANRHILGPFRMLERVMEMLGDESVPIEECVPTPYMLVVPGLAKRMAEGEMGNAFSEGAEDGLLGRYRWFLQMLEGIEVPPAPAAQPPMPDAGAMPQPDAMGMGMPPAMPAGPAIGGPTSDPLMSPLIGPNGGIGEMVPDPLGGGTAMLAAGLPLTGATA